MPGTRGTIALLVNSLKDDAELLAASIRSSLMAEGWRIAVARFDDTTGSMEAINGAALLMTFGGDGTVLAAARVAAPFGVPILPINLGTLGFIAWVRKDEWARRFNEAVSGQLAISERFMLDVSVRRKGSTVAAFSALNDGVVSGSGPAKIVTLSISINGSRLGQYRSDGLIVATPTGSTAYSLAAGGPVLDPDMEAMVFTPICPFTLSNRPIVMPGGEVIEMSVEPDQREKTMLTVDGQQFFDLEEGDVVIMRRSGFKARLFRCERGAFYQVLKSKLNWSGGPDA